MQQAQAREIPEFQILPGGALELVRSQINEANREHDLTQLKARLLTKLARRKEWEHGGDYIDVSLPTPHAMCDCPAHKIRPGKIYAMEPQVTDPHYRLDHKTLGLRYRNRNCSGGVILTLLLEELPEALR